MQILKERGFSAPARIIDAALEDAAPKMTNTTGDSGGLMLADVEPWEEPVDGAEVLELLRSTFTGSSCSSTMQTSS